MTKTSRDSFSPDWISPPGDTIADILEEKDWTQLQLSERMEYTTKHISLLINGKAPITEETAVKLSRVLGGTEKFWLNREANYRAKLAEMIERERLESWVDWLEQLPVKDLMKHGLIEKRRLDSKNKPLIVKDLLSFFGIASPESWNSLYAQKFLAYRRTTEAQSDIGAITSWLRIGELEAEKLNCPAYNKATFQKAIQEIRTLTVLPSDSFLTKLPYLCLKSGVVFVNVPSIKKAHVSGVARWLNPHKALIQLSLCGKSNDKFWFTFFHEVAHILLHSKDEVFLDLWGETEGLSSQQEDEANQWARDFLIPREHQSELQQIKSKEQVEAFAKKLGIHPAIVVGRLQHEGVIDLSCMNDFKESIEY